MQAVKAVRMKEVKRETEFIETKQGDIYLPRPSGWIGGWARHLWFQHKTKRESHIASPSYWSTLSKNNTVKKLVEYSDGTHEVINET